MSEIISLDTSIVTAPLDLAHIRAAEQPAVFPLTGSTIIPLTAGLPVPTVQKSVKTRIPEVSTNTFNDVPAASFWLGLVSVEGTDIMPHVYDAGRVLRANSYIDSHQFLPVESRNADGGETDADDTRSSHFVVLENMAEELASVVGTIRLIRKRQDNELLPIETLFPEAFESEAAPVEAVEASRFIAEHKKKTVQGAISLGLIRAAVTRAFLHDQEPIYAVVEAPLERRFAQVGLPFKRIADPKPLAEYGNTVNMALRFDPKEIFEEAENDIQYRKLITRFFATARQNAGVGYYNANLLLPLHETVKE